jgi:phage-related minor tail protein
MEEQKPITRNKGGRPRKAVKKDQLLAVKCSLFERRAIEARAKSACLTVSEYLREIAMTGKIDRREKALPKEVLALTGTLNHLASNLNQIAKKRNSNEELNALERAELKVQSGELKGIAKQIKTSFE